MAPSQDIKGADSTHPWGHGWCCLALSPTGRNSYIHYYNLSRQQCSKIIVINKSVTKIGFIQIQFIINNLVKFDINL